MNLCDKYKTKCLADIAGQEIAIEKINHFMKNFPEKKAILLHGSPGTGKTSLAYALAYELKAEILELNASDLRNQDKIEKIIGEASKQQSLFNKSKILLLDEVDGITASEDRGGIAELLRIIETTSFPVIMTANKIWDSKFSDLRKKSVLVELKDLNYKTILQIIKTIAKKENLSIDENTLINIAVRARGDVRAAINDLQTVTPETKKEDLDERDKEEKIFNAIKQVLQNKATPEILELFDKVDMPIDEIMLWLEENTPLEYRGEELQKAFNSLSLADVFRGRIYRQQHWRFLIYQNFFLSAGISSSKKYQKKGFVSYKRPERVLKIWIKNQNDKHKKTISEKYASYCHVSIKRAMREFPIIKMILKNENIRKELRLEEDEIAFLDKK